VKDKPTAPVHLRFLTSEAQVLLCLAEDPRLTMREVAARVGITERAIQRIVAALAAAGYVSVKRVGRRNEYVVNRGTPLRGPVVDGRPAGWLFDLLERKAKPR